MAKQFFINSGNIECTYDGARDGKRFLGLLSVGATATGTRPELRVVLNWFDELKARAPIKK